MKKYLKIILIMICVFAALNLVWFGWRHTVYSKYINGMEETFQSTVLIPRYATKSEDGFDYNVKFPDYLSVTGNLAVGFPGTEDDPFTDSLIIWPKLFGGYEYGVILSSLEEDDSGYMFYIDSQGNAVDAEYQHIAERYCAVIAELLERAEEVWHLE